LYAETADGAKLPKLMALETIYKKSINRKRGQEIENIN
jgi:hypothetical protein